MYDLKLLRLYTKRKKVWKLPHNFFIKYLKQNYNRPFNAEVDFLHPMGDFPREVGKYLLRGKVAYHNVGL